MSSAHFQIYGNSKAKSAVTCSPGKILLDQSVFDGQPPEVVIAAVDYDGRLKFGNSVNIRYTWASESWRGAEWINETEGTDYEPLTSIRRDRKPSFEDVLKERDEARAEAVQLREDMSHHITEGPCDFSWENRDETGPIK
jgi:hypothetical protein